MNPPARLFRIGLLASIVALLHAYGTREATLRRARALAELGVEEVRAFYPTPTSLGDVESPTEDRAVVGPGGQLQGRVLQTSPLSDGIVGFSGATNALIALDPEGRVLGIGVLSSDDTREHVEAVLADPEFLRSFRGLRRGAPPPEGIEGVSGATLTSLAIAEGVLARLSGTRPAYRFPEPAAIEEVRLLFPNARRVVEVHGRPGLLDVVGPADRVLGQILRTSPAADTIVGYQGPTDTWLALRDESVAAAVLSKSYDNQPYVRWVSEEDRFFRRFVGRSLDELADLDLVEAGVEGVSGATLTSRSVAAGIVAAARAVTAPATPSRSGRLTPRPRDLGTFAVVLVGLWVALTRLRRKRRLRLALQLVLVGYLGLLQGDLVSQALWIGWAREGVPWHLASGLVLLSGVAVLAPLLGGRQVYCHQLCPHGAAQAILKGRLPWRIRLSRRTERVLRWVPALSLLLVVAVAFGAVPLELVSLEPFHAYRIHVAGAATISIAIVGLAISLVIPMGYCRFGCPTGALLKYLGPRGTTLRLTRADQVAVASLILGAVLYLAGA